DIAYNYPDDFAHAALSKIPSPDLPQDFFPQLTKTLREKTFVLVGENWTSGNRWLMLDSAGNRHATKLTTQSRICRWDLPQHLVIFVGGDWAIGAGDTIIFYIWDYCAEKLVIKTFNI